MQSTTVVVLADKRYWGGILSLKDARDRQEKKMYVFEKNPTDASSRNDFIVEKYVKGKFLRGTREVDPWSLHPMKAVEIEVLELELERPDDA